MQPIVWRALIVAVWIAASTAASAQSPERNSFLSDEGVRELIALALANIGRALCANDRHCAEATPAELANPPITLEEARAVVRRGMLSGMAEACGMDWVRRSFLPMMSYWRHSMRKSERQMALIGMLHGFAQGPSHRLMSQRPCSEEDRRKLDAQLSRT